VKHEASFHNEREATIAVMSTAAAGVASQQLNELPVNAPDGRTAD
jgi:hypothetical protein